MWCQVMPFAYQVMPRGINQKPCTACELPNDWRRRATKHWRNLKQQRVTHRVHNDAGLKRKTLHWVTQDNDGALTHWRKKKTEWRRTMTEHWRTDGKRRRCTQPEAAPSYPSTADRRWTQTKGAALSEAGEWRSTDAALTQRKRCTAWRRRSPTQHCHGTTKRTTQHMDGLWGRNGQ